MLFCPNKMIYLKCLVSSAYFIVVLGLLEHVNHLQIAVDSNSY